MTINGITVVAADIDCTNGVIHVIDAVLVPKA
ncbi:fasciclin domain-containing protein [Yoonia sp.]